MRNLDVFNARPDPKSRASAAPKNKREIRKIQGMMEEMPYISEHLSSLRQEITDLRNLNASVRKNGHTSEVDQTAFELRTNRLREIKQELSQMLNRPDDPKVWWERFRKSTPA